MEGKAAPKKSKVKRILKREAFQGMDYDKALRLTMSFYDETANGYVEFYENWCREMVPSLIRNTRRGMILLQIC